MSNRFPPLRIAALALIVFLAVTIVDAAFKTAVWLATEYVR